LGKNIKDILKTVIPEQEVLRAIRDEAKRNKTAGMTRSQINKEISAYRKERKLQDRALPRKEKV